MNAPPSPLLAATRPPRDGFPDSALLTDLAAPAAMRVAIPRARPMPRGPPPIIYPATAG
jgi:hypothetical protein